LRTSCSDPLFVGGNIRDFCEGQDELFEALEASKEVLGLSAFDVLLAGGRFGIGTELGLAPTDNGVILLAQRFLFGIRRRISAKRTTKGTETAKGSSSPSSGNDGKISSFSAFWQRGTSSRTFIVICEHRLLSGEDRNGMNPYPYSRGSFALCPEGEEDL